MSNAYAIGVLRRQYDELLAAYRDQRSTYYQHRDRARRAAWDAEMAARDADGTLRQLDGIEASLKILGSGPPHWLYEWERKR